MLSHLAPSSLEIPNCFRLPHRDCPRILDLQKPLQFAQFANRRKYIQKSTQIRTSVNNICRATMQQQAESTRMEETFGAKDVPELMIVSDLDFTMVDHDDPLHQSLLNFNSLWAAEYSHNSTLVYSTGRSPQRYRELKRQVPLLTPAIVVSSVGTEIFYGKSLEPDPSWIKLLDEGWDRDIVFEEAKTFPQLRLQEESEQRPHKVSFYLDKQDAPRVQEELFSRLKQRGIDVKLIFSGGTAFDVLPKMGGKGEALGYLMRKMKKEGCLSKNVLVCGDSGNDTELFLVEGVNGVIVSNAQEELIQWYRSHNFVNNIHHASERCAGGIIQALEHYDFGPYNPPRKTIKEAQLQSGRLLDNGSAKREVIEFNLFLEMWLCGHIPDSDQNYERVVEVIDNGATMIYPWGRQSSLKESLDLVRQKHGLMSGKNFMTWIDNIEEKKLADGVYLVTWESWEKLNGGEHKGYYATAILLSKEKTPNGVQWLRVHETSRNDE